MSYLYKYTAYHKDGQKKQGEISARTVEEANKLIRQIGLIPVDVKHVKFETSVGGLKSIRNADLEQSTRQLALLLGNGLRIDKALGVLSKASRNNPIGTIWRAVGAEIAEGKELSVSLKKHPKVFDSLFCEMVAIGESTGSLPEIFNRLAENIQFQNDLRKKVLQAAIYPLFIFIVCLVAIFAIFNFVIPSMSGVFSSMQEIPSYTQTLLDLSDWVQEYQFILFAWLVIFTFVLVYFWRQQSYRERILTFVFRLPFISGMVKKVDRIRFSTAMNLTLSSGLALSSSLNLSANTVLNSELKKELSTFAANVSSGQSISKAIEPVQLYDDLDISLINVGEESGDLAASFREITTISRESFENWVLRFTVLLEPLLILIMGGIVGSVVITMLLSIVSINDVSF
ncbi:type II secretion system F family protein [Paraglaciecola aquimarina]|uniref:Type II secretion system F family protein n=1 Tax=Paraglaciecola algarum TaxID=3050085 RepID=A0ABS9D8W6_9ALTE|nr:type II secretion system F family protein [Paraglaciecola sp. G1-23]MCF2948443.1 type II secretion system F family protein [Paraglaciecola sp. G1-23]